MEKEKKCMYCTKAIYGRTDKKFCDSYCRSSYHNNMVSVDINYVRRINYHLQKNRKILAAAFSDNKQANSISFKELFVQGFSFAYYTHQQEINKEETYLYCYDYGYRVIDNNEVKIVQEG